MWLDLGDDSLLFQAGKISVEPFLLGWLQFDWGLLDWSGVGNVELIVILGVLQAAYVILVGGYLLLNW